MKQVAKVLDAVKALVEIDDQADRCYACKLNSEKRCWAHKAAFTSRFDELKQTYKANQTAGLP